MRSVISGDMCLGNDTSLEIFADNFIRNRGGNFVQPFSKKRPVNFNILTGRFFDSLRRSASGSSEAERLLSG